MTWHLVATVGTSAIYNKSLGKGLGKTEHDGLKSLVEGFSGSPDQTVKTHEPLFNKLVTAHKDFWKEKNRPRDLLRTSAELLSTADIVSVIDPVDILLISSGTDEGEFAATVNCAVMQWRYPKIPVNVLRLAGLDQQFEGVYEAFGKAISDRYKDETHHIAVDVTGGYKGTLLFVAAHAFLKPWTIYYRHEDMDKTAEVNLEGAKWAIREMHARVR